MDMQGPRSKRRRRRGGRGGGAGGGGGQGGPQGQGPGQQGGSPQGGPGNRPAEPPSQASLWNGTAPTPESRPPQHQGGGGDGQQAGGSGQGGSGQGGSGQGPSGQNQQQPNQGNQGHGQQRQGHAQGGPSQNRSNQQNYPSQNRPGANYPRQNGPQQNYSQQNYSPQNQTGPNGYPTGRKPPLARPPLRVVDVDGLPMEMPPEARRFDELTSIDPTPRLTLEYPGCPASCRLIDLFCPIGRGQRGLIVSPPKAGKTTLLKDIAAAVLRNHPDVEVVVLLIDERPEEVTDFRRTFVSAGATGGAVGAQALAAEMLATGDGPALLRAAGEAGGTLPPARQRCRVLASSNDHTVDKHIEVATTTIERCKRMVEAGKHVVVLMDSITRMGRAFNQSRRHASSGRTMTGGLDSKALEVPRQLFGSARNTEEGGSLTIIASCLVDTGSAADQIIFEEFKGSGNMELILDRRIAERRLFPAINLAESGTRKEHLLMSEQEIKTMTALRRRLLAMPPHLQVEQLLGALKRFPTNAALVGSVQ